MEKILENLRKEINLKLTSNEDTYTKHAARANFISGKMFNENLFAINKIKEELFFLIDQFMLEWQYLTYLNY